MKYSIDKELEEITRIKMPANPTFLPIMNKIISLSKCESDDKVNVIRCKTPGYNSTLLDTLIIEPVHYQDNLPYMVFFHGGGFMLKASGTHYQIAKTYAEKIPCRIIYTDYRLAPKYQFPVPAEDCYHTYKWVLENMDNQKLDNPVIIAGDSAGGALALAVTLMARDRGIRIPDAGLLIYPVTDRRMTTDSMKKYVDTPVWDANLSKMMWNAYLGKQQPEKIEYASPVEAASFKHLPPTYIEIAQFDSLRDDGVSLYDKLQEQGIKAELHEVEGACHGFESALESNILKTCMERRINWIKKTLDLREEKYAYKL